MKDFMLLFRGASQQYEFSPEEMQSHMQKWFGWVEELKSRNIYVSGEPLIPEGKLVAGAKKPVITDGPFAESKEIIGGFFIIKAATIEEAAEIAKRSPDLPLDGSVEVREVMKM